MLLGALVVPESPRWLALRGRPAEAVASLQKIQGLSDLSAQNAVDDMVLASSLDSKEAVVASDIFSTIGGIVKSPYNRQALVIGKQFSKKYTCLILC